MKQYAYMAVIIAFFLLMLCFPGATFTGATNGLLLWFQIVLPTLLPFIIISNFLIYTNSVHYVSRVLKPFIQKIFRVSETSCYAVLVGFLCGYPMGAKVIADFVKTKQISLREGQYLLSFCNNTSPMFIISFIVLQNFKNPSLLFGTLFILFLSPVLCSFFFRNFYHRKKESLIQENATQKPLLITFDIFDTCIMNGFETITKVGGYIIIFSILFSFSTNLPLQWFLPTLEISNGIPYIMNMTLSLTTTFPFVLGITSFGGFCSVAQTYSMIQGTKLSIFPYIIQKLITALVTSLFAFLYIQFIHQ